LALLGVAADTPKALKKFKEDNGFKVILIPDPSRKIIKNYNVFRLVKPGDIPFGKFKLAIPSTYLINKEGKIVWEYIGEREDRPGVDLMLDAAKRFL
jgi:peroxiredoxin